MTDTTRYSDETVSNEILSTLTSGLNFNIPNVDLSGISLDDVTISIPQELLTALSKAPTQIDIDTLTKPQIGGNATFDRLMYAVRIHLKEELDKGRITGAEYANAYVSMANAAMQSAVQYELNRYQTNYQAIMSHISAIAAIVEAKSKLAVSKVELATLKVQYAASQATAHTHKASYADTVMSLGIKDATYGNVKQQIVASIGNENRSERITTQQLISFKLKDQRDLAKTYSDIWVTEKNADEGMAVPTEFQNDNINSIYSKLKSGHNLN